MFKRKKSDQKIFDFTAQIIAGHDGKPGHVMLTIEAFLALLTYAQKGEEVLEKSDKAAKTTKPSKVEIEAGSKILLESLAAYTRKQFILMPDNLDDDNEESEDIATFDAALKRGEESFPAGIADKLIDGASPIKTFRKCRGTTQSQLAGKISTIAPYLSQNETGRRTGSVVLLSRVAGALDVDDLV